MGGVANIAAPTAFLHVTWLIQICHTHTHTHTYASLWEYGVWSTDLSSPTAFLQVTWLIQICSSVLLAGAALVVFQMLQARDVTLAYSAK